MANFTGTIGSDTLVGTDAADTFNIGQGGADTVVGKGDDDIVMALGAFNSLDSINGGAGYDRLELDFNYAAGVTLKATTLQAVEEIDFGWAFNGKIVTHDATVAAGEVLSFDGHAILAGQSLYVDGSAETDGSFTFTLGGGNDTFIGGSGGDVIYARENFSNADLLDGGAGSDVLVLGSNYSTSISAAAVTNIETLGFVDGYNYLLVAEDGVVAAGESLAVDARGMTSGGYVIFNGSAETDGNFDFMDSVGNDNLIGGANNDIFRGVGGGTDFFEGKDGDDTFSMDGNLDATDKIWGGLGDDNVSLDGDYSAGFVFDTYTINGVETLTLAAGHSYKLTMNDANVGPDKHLYVSASGLSAANSLNFDGSAETNGSLDVAGGAGNDIFKGGQGNDTFYGHMGGKDTAFGNDGDDAFAFYDGYTDTDFVDGGDGNDRLHLYGNYANGLIFGSKVQNVESITLGPGYSYNVTTLNSLVAAGATMSFDTYYSAAGETFIFNGAAETNGHFALTGGNGNDQLTGGSQSDDFFVNRGGSDVMNGGGGNDVFWLNPASFTAGDHLDGGTGQDTARLNGDFALVIGAQTLVNIETIDLYAGHDYTLTTNDATVAAGGLLTVDGYYLGADDVLKFNGNTETDGRFSLQGGHAADMLRGGMLNDSIEGRDGNDTLRGDDGTDYLVGGAGADSLYGGVGNDRFVFTSVDDSTVAAFDRIFDWNAGDKVNLSAIDANSGVAGDQAFTYIGAAAFSGVAGELQVTTGATTTSISADVDGNGAADFMVRVIGVQTIAGGNFVL